MPITQRLHQALLVLTIGFIVLLSWHHRYQLQRPYDHSYFGRRYNNSQYIMGEGSPIILPDDQLYAYAGYYYLSGGDISQVNFEHPPLGKYLIGLSIIFFGNERVINLIYLFFITLSIYLLGFKLTNNKNIGAIAAFITSIDPVFKSHYFISLLDLPMVVFFLSGLYFFIKGAQQKKAQISYFLSALLFSLSLVTRFFPFLIIILAILIVWLLKYKRDHGWLFLKISLILLPTVYILSHAAYFYYHPSLIDFLRYQKWIIAWRFGNPVVPGNIITTILFGRYRSWWGKEKWLVSSDWSVLTPFIVVLGLLAMWRWRRKFPQGAISILVVIFLIYTAVGTVGVAKYILPIYPLLTIGAVQIVTTKIYAILKPYGQI